MNRILATAAERRPAGAGIRVTGQVSYVRAGRDR